MPTLGANNVHATSGCIPVIVEADVLGAAECHYLRMGRPCRCPFPL